MKIDDGRTEPAFFGDWFDAVVVFKFIRVKVRLLRATVTTTSIANTGAFCLRTSVAAVRHHSPSAGGGLQVCKCLLRDRLPRMLSLTGARQRLNRETLNESYRFA